MQRRNTKNLSEKYMSLLVETIKVKDGEIFNIDYHSARFNKTRKELFNAGPAVDLADKILIPAYALKGLYKCRIEYDKHIRKIDFSPYELKSIRTLKMIDAADLEYHYKFIMRDRINHLFKQRGECDDILMIKNGKICDTSYANTIFRADDQTWYTPSTYLLRGTKREYLLNMGLIQEREITAGNLGEYQEMRLINSMIDIEDTESIPVSSVYF